MKFKVGDKVKLACPQKSVEDMRRAYRWDSATIRLGWRDGEMDEEYRAMQESRNLVVSRVGELGNIRLSIPEIDKKNSWWYYASDFIKVGDIDTEII